ncbi:MAG: AMP-binding protein [Chloroflexota bacterium]
MIEHLYQILQERVARYPDAVALGSQEGEAWRTLDSRQLLAAVEALAAELAVLGVREGDRVAIWAPSSWRAPTYFFAAWRLGAVVVPFDKEVNAESATRILALTEARLLITGYGERPAWAPEELAREWWEPGTLDAAPLEPWQRPREAVAAIYFTSGTTGNPKGCMITHANLCWQAEVLRDNILLDPSCRLGSILPLSHLFELMGGLVYPLFWGAAVHYIPSRRAPDILRVFTEQRITHLNAVPQLLTLMGRGLDEQLRAKLPGPLYGLMNGLAASLPLRWRRHVFFAVHKKLGGHLRMMSSGGSALPRETQELWERLGVQILEGYGTSECSPIVTLTDLAGGTPKGSVGKPIRGVEIKVSPEGELLVKGPNVMLGYYKDPTRTAEVLNDGWYATGDLAAIDARGNVTLQGRAKDLIALPSGMKVWPQDIEDVLREEKVVKDVAVIPVATGAGGMLLHAYLLAAPGVYKPTVDLLGLVARANERLALHQRLASAAWWSDSDFPRTALQKVRRHLLPPPDRAAAAGDSPPLPADEPVAAALMAVARVTSVHRHQTLAELGLDSLAIVELCLAVEEKARKFVAETEVHPEMSVADLQELVARAPAATAETRKQRQVEKKARFVGAWPYTWGRVFRALAFPFHLIYFFGVTQTVVLGKERLAQLPGRLIFAGTHHSYADVSLFWHGLSQTPARHYRNRLLVAAMADGFAGAGLLAKFGILAFGLYPLERHGAGEASLRQLGDLAEKGNAVLYYPQGMHARPEQERAGDPGVRFRPGVAFLARDLGASVVPFGIAGTEKLMTPYLEEHKGMVIAGIPVGLKRGPLAIAFGSPLTIDEGEDEDDFTKRLQDASFALTRDAERALLAYGLAGSAAGL